MESATSFLVLTLLTTTAGKTLRFTGRNLTHVPIDSITPDAQTVRLSDNKISHLGSFNTTPYIRYLFIDNNRVNNLSPQTFRRLGELRILDLDRNYIVSLRDFVFSDLSKLFNLYLSNNLISAISDRTFHGLASLEFLELSGNRLSAVPMQAIRLIPSEQLLLVLLMVNNISQIPGDLTSAHPSASYQFQGNPLRCPDEHVSHDGVFNIDNIDKWPAIIPYVINAEHNRSFVEKSFFLRSRYEYFGVLPNTFYVSQHVSVSLPLPWVVSSEGYAWDTPTGRHLVKSAVELHMVEDFTAEDSGLYTIELGGPAGSTQSYHCDLLLCLNLRPEERQEQNTTLSPSDDFLPLGKNNTDTCEGSTNQSSCSYWPVHPKFCVVEKNNSQATPIIATAVVAIIVMLFSIALFRWRKRRTRREHNHTAGATLHMGVQAMAVGIPIRTLPQLTEDSTEEESSPNAFPLRLLRLRETHWSAMKVGAAQYGFHGVADALPADTVGTTDAQVHHYDNDDASDADEDHQRASVAPPPLPAYENTAAHADTVGTTDAQVHHYDNDDASDAGDDHQHASAAPPPLPAYENTAAHAENTDEVEDRPYGIAQANTLYQGATAPNRRTLTNEHSSSTATNYSAADVTQTETVSIDLYRQQTDHTAMARDITTTFHDCEEDFGILYGCDAATAD
ncbi:LGR5 [Branchiostoma lanceolatum]|uniref:LGR5 protein n=1 Tax=Branchiostoma lanceolatum TaxID=7740 RepID=A0A8J9YSY9_BRALA|nr:LGR5 [Branchiostoma lanceolatum]